MTVLRWSQLLRAARRSNQAARTRSRPPRFLVAVLEFYGRDWPSSGFDRLEAGALLGEHRDDPARGIAWGFNLHDRTDQPRDERSPHRQGCVLAAMLVIAAAPRHFWISRLERLHVLPSRVREAIARRLAGVR
jgi:hypothetical protein